MWNLVFSLVANAGKFVGGMASAANAAGMMGNTTAAAVTKGTLAARLMEKAFGGIKEKFFEALAQGKQFTDLANRMHLRPQEVAAFAEAAQETGIPMKALIKSLIDLRKLGSGGAIGGLKGNLKEAAEILGLSNEEFKVLAAGGSEALTLIADKYQAINDDAQQFALLQALHGKNAALMESIYERSGEEIKGMLDGQVTATDNVLKRNKESAEAFDRMGDRIGVIFSDIASWFSSLVKAIAWIVDVLGLVWDFLGRFLNGIDDLFQGIQGVIGAGWDTLFGDQKDADENASYAAEKFQSAWQNALDWWEKDYLGTFAEGTKSLLGLDINPEATAEKEAKKKEREKKKLLEKPPEATAEEKKKREDLQKELDVAEKKREWDKASNEEKKVILDKEMEALTGQESKIAEDYTDEQEKLMKRMGKVWEIPPDAYKQSSAYLELQKKISEQKDKQLDLEKDIAKEAEKKKQEEEKAAEKAAEEAKKKLKQERELEEAKHDALIEITRRNLESSEASEKEKADFEVKAQKDKLNRLIEDRNRAWQEGDDEAVAALEKSLLDQTMNVDAAQRAALKAGKEDEKNRRIEAGKGLGGKGDSLTSSGLGGALSFSPLDIAKQSLTVQKSMDEKLAQISANTANTVESGNYVSNSVVVPYPQ